MKIQKQKDNIDIHLTQILNPFQTLPAVPYKIQFLLSALKEKSFHGIIRECFLTEFLHLKNHGIDYDSPATVHRNRISPTSFTTENPFIHTESEFTGFKSYSSEVINLYIFHRLI